MAIDFYFDFLSPYAYLAWTQVAGGIDGHAVRPVPVVFGALLAANGQQGPAEIPARRRYVIQDCMRRGHALGVPFRFPERHPFRSVDLLRLCLPEVAGERQRELVSALFDQIWTRRFPLTDAAFLSGWLDEQGFDGAALLDATRRPEIKAALRHNTQTAIGLGIFGVPTFVVGDTLIWGSDRIDDVRLVLSGADPVDAAAVTALEGIPLGVERNAPPPDPLTTRVQSIVTRARFVSDLGMQVVAVEAGRVQTRLRNRPALAQQDGYAHAGVLATLADHTAGAAAATRMPADRTPLSIEFKINLLRPAVGAMLTCDAQVLRAGHRIVVVESTVNDGLSADPVAKATVTLKSARLPS